MNLPNVCPFVVFVNGWQNCCASDMNNLKIRLQKKMNAEIIDVPYSDFKDRGRSTDTSTDVEFLRQGEDFINNRLDRNRPLILIGHSFGGDSILKLLPRIKRRVQFVAVIDPVATFGVRSSGYIIPPHVEYFFNRWQTNQPFPINFKDSGNFDCSAKISDQDVQNIARDDDFSPKRDGKYQKRVTHSNLTTDDYIQKIIGDKIQVQLGIITNGFYRQDGKPNVYYVNVNNRTFCHVLNPDQMQRLGGFGKIIVFPDDSFRIGLRDAGECDG